jgi:hypothetical protein
VQEHGVGVFLQVGELSSPTSSWLLAAVVVDMDMVLAAAVLVDTVNLQASLWRLALLLL